MILKEILKPFCRGVIFAIDNNSGELLDILFRINEIETKISGYWFQEIFKNSIDCIEKGLEMAIKLNHLEAFQKLWSYFIKIIAIGIDQYYENAEDHNEEYISKFIFDAINAKKYRLLKIIFSANYNIFPGGDNINYIIRKAIKNFNIYNQHMLKFLSKQTNYKNT